MNNLFGFFKVGLIFVGSSAGIPLVLAILRDYAYVRSKCLEIVKESSECKNFAGVIIRNLVFGSLLTELLLSFNFDVDI